MLDGCYRCEYRGCKGVFPTKKDLLRHEARMHRNRRLRPVKPYLPDEEAEECD